MRGLYVHKNSMDLCIEVLKTQFRDNNRIKLKVRWWNLGYTGNPWSLYVEKIQIKTEDLKNWIPMEYKEFEAKRS